MIELAVPVLGEHSVPELMGRFAVALALGLMVGSERERSIPDEHAPGIRTFAVMALAGAASVVIDPIVLAAVLLAAVVVAVGPVVRRRKHDPAGYGSTTIAAALAVPLLGALAVINPTLAAALTVSLTVTLASKERVHGFIRNTVTPTELGDAVKFFVVALVVLPLLPDRTFGPFAVVNPSKIGALVVALTGIGWLGYIAVRAFGASRGLPLAGLAGGLVSSTATTAAMIRRAADDHLRRPAISAALLSKVTSLGTLAAVVWFVSQEVLALLALPLLLMVGTLLFMARVYGRTVVPRTVPAEEEEEPASIGRPFALKPALILAAIITTALLVSKAVAATLGAQAVLAVTTVTGIADTQAAAIAASSLVAGQNITAVVGMYAVVAALVANTLFKVVLGFAAGGTVAGRMFAIALAPPTLVLVAAAATVGVVA